MTENVDSFFTGCTNFRLFQDFINSRINLKVIYLENVLGCFLKSKEVLIRLERKKIITTLL